MDNWREKAKELGIPLFHRKKEDVIKDIEAKDVKKVIEVKFTIDARKATQICKDALFAAVAELGLTGITCEKWYLNCKRKGIVFKGKM